MESRFFGLSPHEVMKMACQLAQKNGKVHRFSKISGKAGWEWFQGFLKRDPRLSVRKPEQTSKARAMGFNKPVVTHFFRMLGEVLDKYKFTPDRIWNNDETGVSVVPKSASKVVGKKGRRQVGCLTSAERGQTITVEICMSASGVYMPPHVYISPQAHEA